MYVVPPPLSDSKLTGTLIIPGEQPKEQPKESVPLPQSASPSPEEATAVASLNSGESRDVDP
jgi:hypothetical protein